MGDVKEVRRLRSSTSVIEAESWRTWAKQIFKNSQDVKKWKQGAPDITINYDVGSGIYRVKSFFIWLTVLSITTWALILIHPRHLISFLLCCSYFQMTQYKLNPNPVHESFHIYYCLAALSNKNKQQQLFIRNESKEDSIKNMRSDGQNRWKEEEEKCHLQKLKLQ